MNPLPRHPLLFQVNTRVLLRTRSAELGRQAGFDDIPDVLLSGLRDRGFDWVWFLGVWQTGAVGRAVSRSEPSWQRGFRDALPDLRDEDIGGSPFAIADYSADTRFGGDPALDRLRARVNAAGLRLMLDFVPNHMAPDHRWVAGRPELFVGGTTEDLATEPHNWFRPGADAPVLARGRDPYFPGWPDTAQLDYSRAETRAAMAAELARVAARCDGLRCDMAMLLLPEVFERTWSRWLDGRTVASFWPGAIDGARKSNPALVLMAEVYWDLEDRLVADGFDLAYDKALYDALRHRDPGRARWLLGMEEARQAQRARFLENHDEARAAASFPWPYHRAAALATFAAPGLRFFHQGQCEGARVHIPIHLDRGPAEPTDPAVASFYDALLAALSDPALRDGRHQPLEPRAAWDGNPSHGGFVCALWHGPAGPALLAVSNLSDDRGQCRVFLADLPDRGTLVLADRLGPERWERDLEALGREGLFLDLPGCGINLFALSVQPG